MPRVRLIPSAHGRYICACGNVVTTVQRNGQGAAFFPRYCSRCGKRVKP